MVHETELILRRISLVLFIGFSLRITVEITLMLLRKRYMSVGVCIFVNLLHSNCCTNFDEIYMDRYGIYVLATVLGLHIALKL